MKILCLFLRFGERTYTEAFSGLQKWYRHNIRNASTTFWIIDNLLPGSYDDFNDEEIRVLGGDNSFWEFSAWDAVFASHSDEIQHYDIIHFVTSAYNTLYTGYLNHFTELQLDYVQVNPICLGHIDSYDQPIEIRGFKSQHWIRTCFFFLSRKSLVRIGKILSFDDRSEFFDRNGQIRDGPVSSHYKQCISDWLGGQPLQGVSWHSRSTDLEHFQQKAMAILNEHMLAVRMREGGLSLVDFCWFRNLLVTGFNPDLPFPASWDEQIEFRRLVLSRKIDID